MDNNTNESRDTGWLDEILSSPELGEELGPDESAVSAAGLADPSDPDPDPIEPVRAPQPTYATRSLSSQWDLPVDGAQPGFEPEPPAAAEEAPFRDEEFREAFGEGEMLEQVFATEEPQQPAVRASAPRKRENAPVRKGRPSRKKGYGLFGIPHILATLVWLLICVAIGVSLGRMIWVCASDVLAFGREPQEITVTITDSDDMDTIASKLKNAGLIRYPELFKLYAGLTDAREDISAGTFTLNSIYDYHALVNSMNTHSSAREEVEVMIPEGYTCAQIFSLLEEKGVCAASELETYAAEGELDDYWFLEGIKRGDKYCLEGFLFPDTYRFYTNDTPGSVLRKLLNGFDARFTDIMKDKIVSLNERLAAMMKERGYTQEFIDANKVTVREIVIIASMIEKETSGNVESFTISSVIYNRLAGKEPRYLNIDATIIYALHGNVDPETGKTLPLTSADLKLDHPYNTYTNVGLTPGAISNPGTASLNAALDPDDTDYLYYVYDPSIYAHRFAETYKEHQKNVEEVAKIKAKLEAEAE